MTGVILGVTDEGGPALLLDVDGRGDDLSTDAVDLESVTTGDVECGLADDCFGDAIRASFDCGVLGTALTGLLEVEGCTDTETERAMRLAVTDGVILLTGEVEDVGRLF